MDQLFGAHRRLKRVGVTAVATTLLVMSASCGGSSEKSADSGQLKVLVPLQAPLLDPAQGSVQSNGVLLLGLEPLQRMNADGSLGPELATEVEQPDQRTYVYTIRDGVTFWNGTPLTAEDVVFSFNLHASDDSKSINASLWASVSSVETTGDNEITVKLNEPDPQFPYVVAQTGIVSQAFYEDHAKDVGTPEVLNMGTGPYEFVSFKPSSETVLEANPDYWGDEPRYGKVTVRTVGDDSTRLLAIQSGEFDGIFNVPLNQLESYHAIDGLKHAHSSDYTVYKFNFDTSKAPWNDIHVRRAVAQAINRPALVEGPFDAKASVAPTLVPAGVLGALAPADDVERAYQTLDSALSFDLDAAKKEIAQSTIPEGISVTVPVTASDPNLSAIAQTAAQTLSEIGVDLKIEEVDDNTYYNAVYFEHTTDGLTIDNFSASTPDPANVPIYCLLSTNGLPQGSGVNIAQYADPQVDDLLTQSQRLDTDDPERGSLLLDTLVAANEDMPYVPIAFPNVYAVGNSKLDLSHFSTFWWLTEWTEPASR